MLDIITDPRVIEEHFRKDQDDTDQAKYSERLVVKDGGICHERD